MTAVLALRGVAVAFGGAPILRGVDLAVGEGEVVGLLGRNGAGKTTLIRVATRVATPDSGEVSLRGRPLASYARRELAPTIAVVPQETSVPFAFEALEVVLMGRAPHLGLLGFESGRDVDLAMQAMERIGIAHLADRPVTLLSGGERQLVVLARALAQDAPILLLDEPTAFLDLRHRLEVLSLVRDLARSGRSALVVSHDLGLSARFCDRLALLAAVEGGAQGPPREVLTPGALRRAFDIDADVVAGPGGVPLVVPRPGPP